MLPTFWIILLRAFSEESEKIVFLIEGMKQKKFPKGEVTNRHRAIS
jgi:hypothetical protein